MAKILWLNRHWRKTCLQLFNNSFYRLFWTENLWFISYLLYILAQKTVQSKSSKDKYNFSFKGCSDFNIGSSVFSFCWTFGESVGMCSLLWGCITSCASCARVYPLIVHLKLWIYSNNIAETGRLASYDTHRRVSADICGRAWEQKGGYVHKCVQPCMWVFVANLEGEKMQHSWGERENKRNSHTHTWSTSALSTHPQLNSELMCKAPGKLEALWNLCC